MIWDGARRNEDPGIRVERLAASGAVTPPRRKRSSRVGDLVGAAIIIGVAIAAYGVLGP